jgi:MoaA/NifB/PqqE/SkfB family radical SAM enzyme
LRSPKVSDIKIVESTSAKQETFRVSYGSPRTISYKTTSTGTLSFEVLKGRGVDIEIVSVVNRNDQYDFLNLSDSPYVNKENYLKNKQAVKQSMLARPCIQWFVSWKCNYKCSYCWQEAAHEVYRHGGNNKHSPENWANSFNSLHPKEVYFTGGEPTLYKKLPELINLISPHTSLRMTTNFGPTFNLDRWKEVPANRVAVCASLHPTQVDVNAFISKVSQYTEEYGPQRFGIELVKHPDNLKIVHEAGLVEFCEQRGIELLLDDYVSVFEEEDQDGMEEDLYQLIVETNSIAPLDFTSLAEKVEVPQDLSLKLGKTNDTTRMPVFCPAGSLRINIDAFGDVYTCMSAVDRSKLFGQYGLPHYKPIGNILEPDFELLREPVICWESFRCSACDACLVSKYWKKMDEDFNYQLPICE